jgi:hypothetical protein
MFARLKRDHELHDFRHHCYADPVQNLESENIAALFHLPTNRFKTLLRILGTRFSRNRQKQQRAMVEEAQKAYGAPDPRSECIMSAKICCVLFLPEIAGIAVQRSRNDHWH